MIKIHAVSDVPAHPALRACRLARIDSSNAVCMVHNAACTWATPYGNYCEHPLKDDMADYDPAERGAGDGRLH